MFKRFTRLALLSSSIVAAQIGCAGDITDLPDDDSDEEPEVSVEASALRKCGFDKSHATNTWKNCTDHPQIIEIKKRFNKKKTKCIGAHSRGIDIGSWGLKTLSVRVKTNCKSTEVCAGSNKCKCANGEDSC